MKPVSVFLPCIVGQWLPDIGRAAFKLLCRAGCSPFYHRDQTCCGQMLFNAEHDSQAKKLAMRLIETFENDPVIVCPSGSCVQMVRVNYQLLFANEPKWQSRVQSLAAKVFELSEFLVGQLGLTDLGAKFDGKVAYHESCSLLYGLGISEQSKALLKGVKSLELAHMQGADICCGFGGRFSMDYPEISSAMAEDKAFWFADSGADVLVMGEPGCFLHLSGYMSRHYPERKVMHLASFLSQKLMSP
jgi:L-lactate dehydrogenase complex protein LldE